MEAISSVADFSVLASTALSTGLVDSTVSAAAGASAAAPSDAAAAPSSVFCSSLKVYPQEKIYSMNILITQQV